MERLNPFIDLKIEIQINNKYDMPVRTLYYGSRIFSDQMKESMTYTELKQTITINIVNFKQFGSTDAYHTRFELFDSEAKVTLTDRLQIHFVELPKLLSKWQQKEVNPREDRLVRWLLMLEAVEDETIFNELEEIAMTEDPMLKEAFEKWAEMSSDPETKYAYEARRKQVLDEFSMVREAEIRYEKGTAEAEAKGIAEGNVEGRAEGRAEGRVEGRAEGRVEGRVEGRAEGRVKGRAEGRVEGRVEGRAEGRVDLLRAMLQNGLTMTQIAKMTGLTLEEVERVCKL